MMTRDFAARTRERIAEARAALSRLRELNKETLKQLAKIDKQHVADRSRLYDRLGELADDMISKLPEEASEADSERAYVLQTQINDLAADVEEISIAGSALEDLNSMLDEAVRDAYASLKQSEADLSKMERLGTKLGI